MPKNWQKPKGALRAKIFKKSAHKLAAFPFENASAHRDAVIKGTKGRKVHYRSRRAEPRVFRADDQAIDAAI